MDTATHRRQIQANILRLRIDHALDRGDQRSFVHLTRLLRSLKRRG